MFKMKICIQTTENNEKKNNEINKEITERLCVVHTYAEFLLGFVCLP